LEIVDQWIKFLTSESGLNALDSFGYAPLHYAAKFNRFKILKKLVEAGAGMSICGFSVARIQEVDYMCTSNVFEMYKMYVFSGVTGVCVL